MPDQRTVYDTDLELLVNYTYEKIGDNKLRVTIYEYPGISFDMTDDYHPSETQGAVAEEVKEKMEDLIKDLLFNESGKRSKEGQTK